MIAARLIVLKKKTIKVMLFVVRLATILAISRKTGP